MAKNKNYDYFNGFVSMVNNSCQAAELLHSCINGFEAEKLVGMMTEMHEIEHKADLEKHDMMDRLAKEFITPIEREDIVSLARDIDDVTDSIEDVLIRLYMFNIDRLRPEAADFSTVIIRCCETLKKAMEEFCRFKKSDSIRGLIIEINHLEEEGDKIYVEAVRKLYTDCAEPVEILKWRETFDRFEKCCDACEDVADAVESVIMKNS